MTPMPPLPSTTHTPHIPTRGKCVASLWHAILHPRRLTRCRKPLRHEIRFQRSRFIRLAHRLRRRFPAVHARLSCFASTHRCPRPHPCTSRPSTPTVTMPAAPLTPSPSIHCGGQPTLPATPHCPHSRGFPLSLYYETQTPGKQFCVLHAFNMLLGHQYLRGPDLLLWCEAQRNSPMHPAHGPVWNATHLIYSRSHGNFVPAILSLWLFACHHMGLQVVTGTLSHKLPTIAHITPTRLDALLQDCIDSHTPTPLTPAFPCPGFLQGTRRGRALRRQR